MTEENKDTKRTVFDAGIGNNFTLSGMAFVNGICEPANAKEATNLRNYIEQTGEGWQEVPYDPKNPRHNKQASKPDNSHILTGIQDSGSYSRVQAQASAAAQQAASIIDGSFTQQALENQAEIEKAIAAAATTAEPAKAAVHIKTK
jgi:hypothetical protein